MSAGSLAGTRLPVVTATRYVAPLREGGSLPGIVEADDLGTYVCKFRGAGQGPPVLVAEVIVAGLVEALGLRTPRLVGLQLEEPIARYEADEEVQDLLNASLGLNLGVDFLPGSFGFDPTVTIGPDEAARILWLDAFVANVDRSWRNPNLLVWHGDVWLIDHGASLYFHHGWAGGVTDPARFAAQPYDVRDHVLAAHAAGVAAVDGELVGRLTDEVIEAAVACVPDEWLLPRPGAATPASLRDAYVAFLRARRDGGRPWLPGNAS
ncbi:MAG TPA: HipA family kinase [Marmoricola sp.]|nr:HipA family kinase [Marmoricola sp.]